MGGPSHREAKVGMLDKAKGEDVQAKKTTPCHPERSGDEVAAQSKDPYTLHRAKPASGSSPRALESANSVPRHARVWRAPTKRGWSVPLRSKRREVQAERPKPCHPERSEGSLHSSTAPSKPQGILPVHWSQRDDLIKGFVKGHGFSRAASATNNAGFSP